MATDFSREREDWKNLKQCMEKHDEIREGFVRAVREVHGRYNTSIRENRFITGGVIEILVGAAMRACGLPVIHRGARSVRLDLFYEDDEKRGFSIKSVLKSSTTRRVNVMGDIPPSLSMWDHATVYVLPEGMVYADPALSWWQHHRDIIRAKTDALEVSTRHLREFAEEEPEWFLSLDLSLPSLPPDFRGVRTASATVAVDILKDIGGPLWRKVSELWPD